MSAHASKIRYSKARREWARANGYCQHCYQRPARVIGGVAKSTCEQCYDLQRRHTSYVAYVPLDILLSKPSVAILRALRRFDSVSVGDLFLAVREGSEHARDLRRGLRTCLGNGWAVRDEYGMCSITAAGREWLAGELTRADVSRAA